MNSYSQYEAPNCLVLEFTSTAVLCGSSQPGGNESISIEEWDFQTTI